MASAHVTVKRGHMITRRYLAGCANERGLVYVWDAETERDGVRGIGDATVVHYAYRTEHTTLTLEAEYAQIEGDGIDAIRTVANSGRLQEEGKRAVIEFLDMFMERGRFADRSRVRVPVAVASPFAEAGMSTMGMADRMVLSRSMDTGAIRLEPLKIEKWPWQVVAIESGLVTGDGAVLLWSESTSDEVSAVTFPLSHTRLLVIGDLLTGRAIPINQLIATRCKRWLISHVDGVL